MRRHETWHGTLCSVWLVAVLTLAAAPSVAAQDFFAGKTMTMVVGSASGTGYDAYGRAVMRHLVNHLPGKPTGIVQNMPGAGSTRAAAYMSQIAPKDGTTIAILFPGAIAAPLTAPPGKYRYDPRQFNFLGTADSGTRGCSTSLKSKVKTFEDAKKYEATIGSTAPGGSTFDYPTMLNRLTGTKFKVVPGYKSTGSIALAIERGEVDGWCGIEISTYHAVRPNWIANKEVNFLVQLGLEPNEEMTKAGFPEVWKFVPPENKVVMEMIVSQQVFQRPFVAPPGTPADRVKLLAAAFDATMKDKAFLAEAEKSKLSVNPRTGAQVKALVDKMYSSPKELVERMAKAVAP
ncbi:MAG: Bug family tripartite tricarboxylate transporter substrate binding protein [Hyphomicrobiaceae bacterium]